MKHVYFFRIAGVIIPEVEERFIKKMSRKGFAPCTMTSHIIKFKQVKPENLNALVTFCDLNDSDYLNFAREMHDSSWEYVCNDGVCSAIFVSSKSQSLSVENIKIERKAGLKRFKQKILISLLYFAAFLLIFLSNGVGETNTLNIPTIIENLSLWKKLFYVAMADYSTLSFANACFCLRDYFRIAGKIKKRKTCFSYLVSWVLFFAFFVLIVIGLILAVQSRFI